MCGPRLEKFYLPPEANPTWSKGCCDSASLAMFRHLQWLIFDPNLANQYSPLGLWNHYREEANQRKYILQSCGVGHLPPTKWTDGKAEWPEQKSEKIVKLFGKESWNDRQQISDTVLFLNSVKPTMPFFQPLIYRCLCMHTWICVHTYTLMNMYIYQVSLLEFSLFTLNDFFHLPNNRYKSF